MMMRSMKSLALGAAAAALIAGGGLAVAQTTPPPTDRPAAAAPQHPDRAHWRGERFVRFLDTDKDGKVSLKEIEDEEVRLFGAADVNGDGFITADEITSGGPMGRPGGPSGGHPGMMGPHR
jgi:hypothetical protein